MIINQLPLNKMRYIPALVFALVIMTLASCSVQNKISRQANQILLKDSAISQGHIGIAVYDFHSGKYLYQYNADKYFIPASNTKLFSWYAGMKYLGDSLVGLRYQFNEVDSSYIMQPTGDPSFLLPEFSTQPVIDFLRSKNCNKISLVDDFHFYSKPYGRGWAWDDYQEEYMPERSAMPINGNLVSFYFNDDSLSVFPGTFYGSTFSSVAGWNKGIIPNRNVFSIYRKPYDNYFQVASIGRERLGKETNIPFKPSEQLTRKILEHALGCKLGETSFLHGAYRFDGVVHSQPADSLFKKMMHRSDNFFAEQTLLMASNEFLRYMSSEKMIDTILKTTLKDLPQTPQWVDGSGLSRYNLFTPQDFIFLLRKIKKEYTWERITNTLTTGGEGTLRNYYKEDAGFIYAKTGTLSNNCAVSGYLVTKKGKLLLFSVLANNYGTGATPVRRAVEKFIQQLREKY